ncbi:MAG: ABC transporter permease [Prevotella sp.]|jgi:ABC-2 type transport system permease protein
MKTFLSFVIKESKHILRDPRVMLILFGMPVVMMLLFGFALSTDVRDVRTVVVTSSYDQAAQRLVQALGASEYFDLCYNVSTTAEAEKLMVDQKADIALVFSPDFANHRYDGTARVQVVADAADPNMAQQYVSYVMQIFQGQLSSKGYTVPASATGQAAAMTMAMPRVSTKLLYNPQMKSAYNFVPGIMGVLLMLICAMMTSVSIVREKERHTMEVILVSPVRPLAIIIAKAVPYLVLSLVILTTILVMSKWVLGVPLEGSLFLIYLLSLVYILLALALGLLISTVVSTQLAALLCSAMLLLLPSIMLSGMVYPIESMPAILQWITYIVPPRYYVTAMRKLMIMGVGFGEVMQEFVILSAMTLLLLALALKKFNNRL